MIKHHGTSIDFAAAKQQAIELQPKVAKVPLSLIELGPENSMKIKGAPVKVTEHAYMRFLSKVLRVDGSFIDRFKSATNEKTKLAMLATLKTATSKIKSDVFLVQDNIKGHIMNFSVNEGTFMTNKSVFGMVENIMNRYSELKLSDFYINEYGEMTVNVRSDKQFGFSKDETFSGGLSFSTDMMNGVSVSHNILRLICVNGMTMKTSLPLFFGNNEKRLNKFYEDLDTLSKNRWEGVHLLKQIQTMMQHKASWNEVNIAKKILMDNSNLNEKGVEKFIPTQDITAELARKGIAVESLTNRQMKNCPTSLNGWDLINTLTHFGSHDKTYDANYGRIQLAAGKMLAAGPDTADLVFLG